VLRTTLAPAAWAAIATTALCAAFLGASRAQRSDDRASELMRDLETVPPPRLAPPSVAFAVLGQVTIPGPLEGAGPERHESGVAVRGAGGLLLVPWSAEGGLGEVVTGPVDAPPLDERRFGLAPDGSARAGVLESGHLVVETACRRCGDGWNRRFRLHIVGTSGAPPLVTDRRVFYAARDNVVYCVRRDNGHRVWERLTAGRVVPSLVAWSGVPRGALETAEAASLVLAVTDEPSAVVALDARTGEQAALYDAGPERTIVGAPFVLPDGRLLAARQDYRSSDAALVLLEIVWRDERPRAS